MILHKPLAQVFYDDTLNESFLHCITYFSDTRYEYNGNEMVSSTTNDDGNYTISLHVKESTSTLLNYITPVVHLVPLGNINLETAKLNVRLTFQEQIIGKGIVIDIDTNEDSRPDGETQNSNGSNSNWL